MPIDELEGVIATLDDMQTDEIKCMYPHEYCLIEDCLNLLHMAKESFENKSEGESY